MFIALIHKRASLPVTPVSSYLMFRFFPRYQPMRSWLTLLLYIVEPVCGMQLSSIFCLQMKNHWFWRECALHVLIEASELTVY